MLKHDFNYGHRNNFNAKYSYTRLQLFSIMVIEIVFVPIERNISGGTMQLFRFIRGYCAQFYIYTEVISPLKFIEMYGANYPRQHRRNQVTKNVSFILRT